MADLGHSNPRIKRYAAVLLPERTRPVDRWTTLSKNPPVIGDQTAWCFQEFEHAITACPKSIVYSHRDSNAGRD